MKIYDGPRPAAWDTIHAADVRLLPTRGSVTCLNCRNFSFTTARMSLTLMTSSRRMEAWMNGMQRHTYSHERRP